MEVEWVSVDDRLPEHGHLLVLVGWKRENGTKNYTVAIRMGDKWIKEIGKRKYIKEKVTHWMELPTTDTIPNIVSNVINELYE